MDCAVYTCRLHQRWRCRVGWVMGLSFLLGILGWLISSASGRDVGWNDQWGYISSVTYAFFVLIPATFAACC